MKHLILYINHAQSRLDNAVYRLFASSVLGRRNAVLLFEPKLPDERLLAREIAGLYKKQNAPDDVTFHICADFRQPDQAADVIATLRLIRSLYPSSLAPKAVYEETALSDEPRPHRKDPQLTFFDLVPEEEGVTPEPQYSYPTYVYAMTQDATLCTDAERNILWRNLTALSQAAMDNYNCHLISTCLLYLPSQQQALAEYLYECATGHTDQETLSTPFDSHCSYPPIFGSINAEGLSYPEEEVRHYLQLCCLRDTLRLGHPDYVSTPMEVALNEAEYLLSQIPLQNDRLLLQEAVFLNLDSDQETRWALPAEYWPYQVEMASQGLNDLPRDDWFIRIRQRVEALYQTRYRELGVELFCNVQTRLIGRYNEVLLAIIGQRLDATMQEHLYAPEVQQRIVRALINTLQQKVLYLQQQEQNEQHALAEAETRLDTLHTEWGKMSLWSRLRGKDQELLTLYARELSDYYILRSRVAAYPFADKLLNQLIPQLIALTQVAERRQEILCEALRTVDRQLGEARPSQVFQLFDANIVEQAAACIQTDAKNLRISFGLITRLFYDHGMPLDGDEYLSRIRFELDSVFEEYVTSHAERWTTPPVLGLFIGRRIELLYEGRGGKEQFIQHIRNRIPILVPVKGEAHPSQLWLYSETGNHLEVIHLQHGLSLTDLSGFSGQRAYIEASLF